MNENPGLYVEVIGHTDSKGSSDYNKKLSINRSRAVIDYLVARGVEKTRFVAKGDGKEALVAIDMNKDGTVNNEGAKLNRRVEVRVLKSDNNMIVTVEEFVPENIRNAKFNRYSIVLKETVELLPNNAFEELKPNISEAFSIPTQQGYIYYGGDYKDQAAASKDLNLVISKGYKDARIVDYFELNSMNRFVVKNKVNWPIKYTIQLKAVDKQSIIDANGIKDIKIIKTADGYLRYTYKEFTDLKEAEVALKEVYDRGFTNAFIIEVSKLK